MDNKFDVGIKKTDLVPEPITKAPTTQEQIKNLENGGQLTIAIDALSYNQLYDQFKPQRKAGDLAFEFDSNKCVATIKNLKKNDAKV